MNVLSLFDGMSCGQLALQRAGIRYENYFASEIDKHAIKVTQANFPATIQLGDVTKVKAEDLPKIDLLIGGSPCQGFSFAGKQMNFEDPRSKLFFEFVRLLFETKPKYFLLENVKMKKQYQDIISLYLGVEPIEINSSLVSAQNRVRLYWTNIPNVTRPEDKGILLKDILENGFSDRDKSFCIDVNYFKGGDLRQYFTKSRKQIVFKSRIVGRPINKEGKRADNDKTAVKIQCLEVSEDSNKANCLTTVPEKDCLISSLEPGRYLNAYSDLIKGIDYRKLTLVECERLQTVPDNYTAHVSDSQRYKMLGNGWTVDVIAHIFKNL